MGTQPLSLVPPFTRETAAAKVRKAEDNWNSRDPEKVALWTKADSVTPLRRDRDRTTALTKVPATRMETGNDHQP